MRNIDEVFEVLERSRFRREMRLSPKEAEYLRKKGLSTILEHAYDFVISWLADAQPENDGRQTPMKNHPVFVAQHATATCCRKCLEKLHHIPQDKSLTTEQIDYIISVIKRWLLKSF